MAGMKTLLVIMHLKEMMTKALTPHFENLPLYPPVIVDCKGGESQRCLSYPRLCRGLSFVFLHPPCK